MIRSCVQRPYVYAQTSAFSIHILASSSSNDGMRVLRSTGVDTLYVQLRKLSTRLQTSCIVRMQQSDAGDRQEYVELVNN